MLLWKKLKSCVLNPVQSNNWKHLNTQFRRWQIFYEGPKSSWTDSEEVKVHTRVVCWCLSCESHCNTSWWLSLTTQPQDFLPGFWCYLGLDRSNWINGFTAVITGSFLRNVWSHRALRMRFQVGKGWSCKVKPHFPLTFSALIKHWAGSRWPGLKKIYIVPEGQLESAWQFPKLLSLVFQQYLMSDEVYFSSLWSHSENRATMPQVTSITITLIFLWKHGRSSLEVNL